MSTIVDRFEKIKLKINSLNPPKPVKIIAVSKTFDFDYIKPLVDHGHIHFGENKVQEAFVKWSHYKKENEKLKLHMIGKLQSNKAKDAVKLFDYIHSVDNQKLADALSKHQINLNKNLNTSEITLDEAYKYCVNEINLNIIGLMVIPPNDQNANEYFKSMNELNKSLALSDLSMGMSADYIEAIKQGSNYIRVGSSIFGSRS